MAALLKVFCIAVVVGLAVRCDETKTLCWSRYHTWYLTRLRLHKMILHISITDCLFVCLFSKLSPTDCLIPKGVKSVLCIRLTGVTWTFLSQMRSSS